MSVRSETLFHFTKSLNVLEAILLEGYWPRYCLEDIAWLGTSSASFVSFPTVCFCDIPLSRIAEHVSFYGNYGLGMSKEWAEANNLNPVLYVAGKNHLSNELLQFNTHANKLKKDEQEEAKTTMRYLFAHIKPTAGTMVMLGEPVEKVFYQESEWRYVPKSKHILPYLSKEKYDDNEQLEAQNGLTKKHCSLKFTPSDVKYIFVKTDSDIPGVVDFIQAKLDKYPAADLKILVSRIVSLESLRTDL